MADLKAMREELRALRKDSVKPVSRMRKADIASEIQRLKGVREETPISAATISAPPKKSKSAVETIKEAKKMEFPVAPVSHESKPKSGKSSAGKKVEDHSEMKAKAEKKKSKLERLMQLMEMSDSE